MAIYFTDTDEEKVVQDKDVGGKKNLNTLIFLIQD